MNYACDNKLVTAIWLRLCGVQDRYSKVEMLIVFTQYDFILGVAVNFENANAVSQRCQVFGSLEAKTGDDYVS